MWSPSALTRISIGLLTACVGFGLAGCGSTSGANTITLYNGQHDQTTAALAAAFTKQTGIKVRVRSDSEGTLVQEILQEGAASPADVVYTENTPALERLREKGVLGTVDASTLAQTPSQYNSPTANWVGVSARITVLVYNTRILRPSELPTSALDLADKRWAGKFGFAPTETDLQPVVISIAKARGDAAAVAWLKALKANAGNRIYPDNETVTAAVNSGASALSIENHYYWFRLAKEDGVANMHSAVSYLTPGDPGFVRDVSGAAVLRSSKHQAAAQELLAFLTSKRGEETLAASDSYEYPLGSGVAGAPVLRPFDQLQPSAITPADLGDGSLALQLERQAGIL